MTYKERYEYQKEITLKQREVINRQKAEIENYQKYIDHLTFTYDIKGVKAEAIKEFVDRVKQNQRKLFNYIYSDDGFGAIIDNLVKEMVGDVW